MPLPTAEIPLGKVENAKQEQPHTAQHDDAGIHFQIIDAQPRVHDEIAHAVLRAEGLGEEQHGNRRRHRHADRGHEFRQRRGQKHFPKHHAERRAQRRQRIKRFLGDGADAVAHGDDDLKDENQKEHDGLGTVAKSENQHDDRKESDFRHRICQIHQRRKQPVRAPRPSHRDAKGQPDADGEQDAREDAPETVRAVHGDGSEKNRPDIFRDADWRRDNREPNRFRHGKPYKEQKRRAKARGENSFCHAPAPFPVSQPRSRALNAVHSAESSRRAKKGFSVAKRTRPGAGDSTTTDCPRYSASST